MNKELRDCSGCIDPRSEGTHQMHTIQHPCQEGGDPNCGYCTDEKPAHEIGWEQEFDAAFDWIESEKERCKIMYGFTSEKLKDFIRSLLAHQQERFIEVLEGMKGNRQWECGRYDEALTDAIEQIKAL